MLKIKILPILLFGLLALTLTNCGDDEAGGDDIEGTWKITKLTSTNCTDPEDNQTLDLTNGDCLDFLGFEICFDITMNFKGDGTYVQTTVSTTDILGTPTTETDISTGTWSVSGDQLTTCDDDGNECETNSFNISGGTLTATTKDFETGCDVSLTATR